MSESPEVLIIGGGSAGLFCALGLADRARVTLVEGGPDPGAPLPAEIPHIHQFGDAMDWGYRDAETDLVLLRGRVLGGSSTTNASAGVRGQPGSFDAWGPGWTWDDCLPAFRAIERDVQFGSAAYHGDAGPIRMTRLPYGAIDEAFSAACARAGHAVIADHNAPGAFGVGPWPTNRDEDGGRMGTLAGVMPLLRGRITLVPDTVAVRLEVEGGRLAGVVLAGPDGAERTVRPDHLVLSAGAYGTPELLLRSGIGPAAELEAEGIRPVVDLPGVGRNLQDHPWAMLKVMSVDPDAPAARPVSGALLRWGIGGDTNDEGQAFPFQTWLYDSTAPPAEVSTAASIMAPRSRGDVRVAGGRTVIRLRHLDDPSDVERMGEVVAHTGAILEDMAHAGVVSLPDAPWWRHLDPPTLRAHADTYNHPVGTCALGDDDDPDAVVDRRLRLRGVEGVTVADASVMPVIPQTNTNLASMMIGARAAGMI